MSQHEDDGVRYGHDVREIEVALAQAACRATVGHELEACGPDCLYFDEPRTCTRCGWEEQWDERETYCRPDLSHDYPAKS